MNGFEPIKKIKLIDEVAKQLKRVIKKQYYKTGDKLPTERALADQLNVSRATMREVLKRLQSEGLLEIKRGPYGGAYIVDIQSIPIIENYKNLIYMDKVSFIDIIEARLYIEPMMAKYAACYHSKEDIDRLYELMDKAENAKGQSLAKARQENLNFHCEVAKLNGNFILYQQSESLLKVFSELLYDITDDSVEVKALSKPFREHYDILNAIKNNEPENAYESSIIHLLNAYKTYASHIEQTNERTVEERIRELNCCFFYGRIN